MPFTKGQSDDLSELRTMAYGWGKIVSRRAYGEQGPGLDLDYDSIESLAVEVGQAVIQGAIEEVLKTQLKLLGDHQPCPTCTRLVRFRPSPGPSRDAAARSNTTNRSAIARPVAGIFFPLRPTLRLNSHGFSPAIFGKIARFAARCGSFKDAAESLQDGAEITISDPQVRRIAQEIGEQLRQERDHRVEQFQDRQAAPEVPVVPPLAAVFVDGGRLQVRSEVSGQGPGVHDPAWREDKVANLVTMSTQSHAEDPHPELPECFTKKLRVVELVQGISGQGAMADVVEANPEPPPSLTLVEPTEADTKTRPCWPPEPLVRTCQATMESSEAFGPMVAAEANRRRFFKAQARAFVGDGGSWIWTLHRTHFPTFEPIVDFVHALTYIYLAARAIGGPATTVWERYLNWATACWQGGVAGV